MSVTPSGPAAMVALSAGQLTGLVGVSLMLAAGQILFKRAAATLSIGEGLVATILSMITLPMATALVVYAVATLLWVYLLHSIPLSRAYPFVALAFALVPLASWLVLGEHLGPRYFVGLALMLVSVWIIASN